jgi:hypothetical protein
LSPTDEAAAEGREILDLRARLERAGIRSHTLRQLLTVASVKGGVATLAKIVSGSVAQRRKELLAFIERECAAHSELHGLLDDPLETDCHPKKAAGCVSKVLLVRHHFGFCRALMGASGPTPKRRAEPRSQGKRLLVLPQNARTLGSVIRVLGDAGLNQREIAILWLDHERSKREAGVPLTKNAIEAKHHAVRTAAHAQRKRSKHTT